VRCGTIAKKLGHYPLWKKDGTRINTTVLQIVENHVIKYIPPGSFNPTQKVHLKNYSKSGCILVGSETANPNNLTGNYIGLFKESGVLPTKRINRFIVHPDAALSPGTQLNVSHYRVGDFVDVRGLT
jgi:large subunit ribosomal protein L3